MPHINVPMLPISTFVICTLILHGAVNLYQSRVQMYMHSTQANTGITFLAGCSQSVFNTITHVQDLLQDKTMSASVQIFRKQPSATNTWIHGGWVSKFSNSCSQLTHVCGVFKRGAPVGFLCEHVEGLFQKHLLVKLLSKDVINRDTCGSAEYLFSLWLKWLFARMRLERCNTGNTGPLGIGVTCGVRVVDSFFEMIYNDRQVLNLMFGEPGVCDWIGVTERVIVFEPDSKHGRSLTASNHCKKLQTLRHKIRQRLGVC